MSTLIVQLQFDDKSVLNNENIAYATSNILLHVIALLRLLYITALYYAYYILLL